MKNYAPGKGPDYGEDKLHPKEIELKGGTAEKAENFWFYHKWKVIIALFLVFVLLVACLQTCDSVEDDILLLYAGPCNIGASGIKGMGVALADVLPSDFNGDGENHVTLVGLNIFSPEQVADLAEQAKTDPNIAPVNTYVNQRELSSFDNLILTGEYSVCLLDPWLCERVASSGGLAKLSDVLGSAPKDAYSAYAVTFKDTAFAKAHAEEFQYLPDDTLLCMRNTNSMGTVINKDSTLKKHTEAVEMFKAIMNYK
jgi:hypothetical protein